MAPADAPEPDRPDPDRALTDRAETQQPGWSGILLAGPREIDTTAIAFALTTLARRYARLPWLTTARTSNLDTTPATAAHLAELARWGQVFHQTTHAGTTHIHDHPRLHALRETGRLPVVTIDTAATLAAFTDESPHWLSVLFHNPAIAAETRRHHLLRRRGGDQLTRYWDQFTLTIRTDQLDRIDAAHLIHRAAQTGLREIPHGPR